MDKINEILNDLGISKVKLAKYLGVSRQMIYNYLKMDSIKEWPKEKATRFLALFSAKSAAMEFFVVQKSLIDELRGCFGVQSRSKRSKFRQKRCGMCVVVVEERIGKEEVAEEPNARIEGVDGKIGKASDKDTEVLFEFRRDGPSILAEANSFVETRLVAIEFEVEMSSCGSELEYLDELGTGFDGECKITETDDNTSAILALLCLQHSLAAGKTTSDNTDLVALGEHDIPRGCETSVGDIDLIFH